MTPEKQAALIAEWLDKPPGTPPPEGVDPDAIEAIYALKPQLAPAPRVSIDDILAGVGEGPFYEGTGIENKVAELPLAQAPAPVVEEPEAPQQEAQVIDLAARRRRRIWGGVGVAAMAALVLFSIAPEEGFENLADAPLPAEQQAAPSADAVAELAEEEALAKDDTGVQRQLAKPAAKSSGAASTPSPEPQQEWEAPPAPPAEPDPAAAEYKEQAPSGRYDQLELSSGSGSSYGDEPADVQAVTGNTASNVDVGYFEDEAPMEEAEEELADAGVATQSIAQSVSRKAERSAPSKKRGRTRSEPASEVQSVAPSVADMEFDYGVDDDMDEAIVVEEPIPTDLAGLRAAAVPADYNSGWYLKTLDDAELDRFDKALETSDEAALIGDSNVLIGQDMAFRAAKRAMESGQNSQALSYVRQGQKRSSANTAFKANLHYLEGRILERMGDTEAAKQAYTTAANLNRAR